MQKSHLKMMIFSSQRRPPGKRPAETWGKSQPVFKKPRTNLLVCSMESETSLSLESSKYSYSSIDMPSTSRYSCPTAEPPPIHQPKEAPGCRVYDPFDFTSDELNPAYEWLRNPSLARKCSGGVNVISMLRSILSPFPLGLRLTKLETMLWNRHKINLSRLCLEQGYRDILQFLQGLPGIILKFQQNRPLRCLVQLDPAGGRFLY